MPAGSVPARRADLSGLPPTWIGVGTIDLFYDEDVVYAQRLKEAGVPCELVIVPGAFHAFDLSPQDASGQEFSQVSGAGVEKCLDGMKVSRTPTPRAHGRAGASLPA